MIQKSKIKATEVIAIVVALAGVVVGILTYLNQEGNKKGSEEDPIVVRHLESRKDDQNFKITRNSIGGVKVGMESEEANELYRGYEFKSDYHMGGILTTISKNDTSIVNWYADDQEKITWISTYNTDFELFNGLKVGADLGTYFSVYQNEQRLFYDFHDNKFFLKPYDMNSKLRVTWFYVDVLDEEYLFTNVKDYFGELYYDVSKHGVPEGSISGILMTVEK
ncbi:hypothetical protein [Tunicatimonas pelagia]|uniref:hypothetical protein n=1 Tax=Tunicatimonas pelagia TaxID=931531 RepID=UPI002665A4D4|nr:hypothetical protein [Tunicatimonas pelagia]WKN46510.1 hypothetical protein P0M28_30635 [Tunicatimonas pelagia]